MVYPSARRTASALFAAPCTVQLFHLGVYPQHLGKWPRCSSVRSGTRSPGRYLFTRSEFTPSNAAISCTTRNVLPFFFLAADRLNTA